MSQTSVIFGLILIGLASVFQVHAKPLRDPTLPQQGAKIGQLEQKNLGTSLVLRSVMRSGDKASVVINDSIYVVGDRVQGVKISRIGNDSVFLSDGRKLTLFKAITEGLGK